MDVTQLRPRRLATIRVRLTRVLDLTNEKVRAALGVSAADLVSEEATIPRAIGEMAHHLGYEAILAPSAAGRGTVLAFFLDNRTPDSVIEIERVADDHVPGSSEATAQD